MKSEHILKIAYQVVNQSKLDQRDIDKALLLDSEICDVTIGSANFQSNHLQHYEPKDIMVKSLLASPVA